MEIKGKGEKGETLTDEQLATAISLLQPVHPMEHFVLPISLAYLLDLRNSGFLTEEELTQLLKGIKIKGLKLQIENA